MRCDLSRSPAERAWQSEVREDAAVAEPGDRGESVPLEREHHQPVWARYRALRVAEVATEGGLAVGARGQQLERSAADAGPVAQELCDCGVALVLEGVGRHPEPGV